jgi:CheY-like chemotaxis protein
MSDIRILLVDDDEVVRATLSEVLQRTGFAVTTAGDVVEALRRISSETYDVLVTDLHMPEAGDGLTVISAMRHANPQAVTLLLTALPRMEAAAQALLMQVDEILLKPMDVRSLVDAIRQRLVLGRVPAREIESVATVLERTTPATIQAWYTRIQTDEMLMSVPMSHEVRCSHFHQVCRDLVSRLLSSEPIGSSGRVSSAAARHGLDRRRLGYSAAMLVEEWRMLQVSIFQTLQSNLAHIDFSLLLTGIMTIADEIDFQLSQAMAGFTAESLSATLP